MRDLETIKVRGGAKVYVYHQKKKNEKKRSLNAPLMA